MKKTTPLALLFITSFWILLAAFPVQSHASETGQCGDSVYYELKDNGAVRIYGSGVMWDYPFAPENQEQLSPFRKAGTKINKVVIESGVTNVGACSFTNCSTITQISLPEGITDIEEHAFENTGISGIILPESLKVIWNYAFQKCTHLTTITIPSNVMSIHFSAFLSCTAVTSYNVAESNHTFSSENGVLYNKGKDRLLRYPSGRSGAFVIPDSVYQIMSYAFQDARGLTEITIPESVGSAGPGAFEYCTALTSVTIPGNLEMIEARMFYGCTSLKNVTICSGIKYIGASAFAYASQLTFVELPDTVISISSEAFSCCFELKGILIPESVTAGEEDIFLYHRIPLVIYGKTDTWAEQYAKDHDIPFRAVNGKCGENVYWSMDADGNLVIVGNGPMYEDSEYTGTHPFKANTSIHSVTIIKGVTRIGSNTFYGCSGISHEIVFPDGLYEIGANAFRDCSSLPGIFIPKDAKSIERYAFKGCTALEKAYFDGSKNTPMTFGTTIYDKTDKLVVYANMGTMAYIDAKRRGILYYLTDPLGAIDYYLPYDLTVINEEAFAGTTAHTIFVDQKNLKTVGKRAFANSSSLEKIVLPDSVTSIADDAFAGCRSDLMIYGFIGSYVEEYARSKGYPFALAANG